MAEVLLSSIAIILWAIVAANRVVAVRRFFITPLSWDYVTGLQSLRRLERTAAAAR